MVLGNIFKSKATRRKEERRKKFRAFNQAQGAIASVRRKIQGFTVERDKLLIDAKKYLAAGRRDDAQRCVVKARANNLMIDKLEKKCWASEQMKLRMEMAENDNEFNQAFQVLNDVVTVDPDAVMDLMSNTQEMWAEQKQIDDLWVESYEGELTDMESEAPHAQSVAEMMELLENEVSNEIEGYSIGQDLSGFDRQQQLEEINSGVASLEKLMEKNG